MGLSHYGRHAHRDAGLLETALWQLCGWRSTGCGLDCSNGSSHDVSLSHDKGQDSCDNEFPLPAPVEMAAPRLQREFAAKKKKKPCMTPVATSAQFSLHGQSGPVEPPQLHRGSGRSRLTLLWCWADATLACTRRTGTCLSSLNP